MRRHRFLVPAAWLLAAVFFASQAFACCLANARFGQAIASLIAPLPAAAPAPESGHACCPKPESTPLPDPGEGEKGDCTQSCCIQDAAHLSPQLASAPADLPDLSGPLGIPAPAPQSPAPVWEGPAPVSATGPPVYLRTLRLLV